MRTGSDWTHWLNVMRKGEEDIKNNIDSTLIQDNQENGIPQELKKKGGGDSRLENLDGRWLWLLI